MGSYSAVAVGLRFPVLERTIRLVDMVAYAGATWDWHPIHYDRDYVERLGLPGPLVDGQAMGAYLAEQVLDPFGPLARVRRMSFRLLAPVFAGETIRVDGTVTAVEPRDGGSYVTLRQGITVDRRVVVERATTEVMVAPWEPS